jgi:hypothetical protein
MLAPMSLTTAVLACLAALWVSCSANAQSTIRPADEKRVIRAEGVEITLAIRSEVTLANLPAGGIRVGIRARASLDDLQAKGPNVLRAIAKKDSDCRTRWSFPNIPPIVIQDGRLGIEGRVHAEKWLCEKVLGNEVKTRLVSVTADFVVTLRPVHTESEVAVSATIEKLDLGSGVPDDLEREVKRRLSASLSQALAGDDKKLKFPPEIADTQPRFTKAAIAAVQDGKGELDAEAEAVIRNAEDLAKIMGLIARRGKAR